MSATQHSPYLCLHTTVYKILYTLSSHDDNRDANTPFMSPSQEDLGDIVFGGVVDPVIICVTIILAFRQHCRLDSYEYPLDGERTD